MKMIRLILIATVFMLYSVPTNAQGPINEKVFWQKNMDGWGGIVFTCHAWPANISALIQICERTNKAANFLAASGKIKYAASKINANEYAILRVGHKNKITDPLHLVVDVLMAGKINAANALSLRVTAERFYVDAVEKGKEHSRAEGKPKSGTMVFWERGIVMTDRAPQGLIVSATESARGFIQDFLTIWLEARN